MSRGESLQLLEEITSAFKELVGIRTKAERQLDHTSSQLDALLLSVRTLHTSEEYSLRFESPEATRERQPGSSPQPAPSSQDTSSAERTRQMYEREIEKLKKYYEGELFKMKHYYEGKLKAQRRGSSDKQADYSNLSASQMRRILAEQDKTIEYQEKLIEDLMQRADSTP